MKRLAFAFVAVLVLSVASIIAQDAQHDAAMKDCPMHGQHAGETAHHADVNKQGDQAMGFPHDRTTHHFRLQSDGGAIEITANDPSDKTNTEAIRSHLSHIAVLFGNGDFSTPMFIHDAIPPGVTTMRLLKAAIRYKYEQIPAGGRVQIESADAVAVAAIHDFLRFQISEHETGDPLTLAGSH